MEIHGQGVGAGRCINMSMKHGMLAIILERDNFAVFVMSLLGGVRKTGFGQKMVSRCAKIVITGEKGNDNTMHEM